MCCKLLTTSSVRPRSQSAWPGTRHSRTRHCGCGPGLGRSTIEIRLESIGATQRRTAIRVGPHSRRESTELCGGTHVRATGEIGQLKLVSEGGIAAGVRRLEAFTGRGAFGYLRGLEEQSHAIGAEFKSSSDENLSKVRRVLDEQKNLRREIEALKRKLVAGGAGSGPAPVSYTHLRAPRDA